MNSLFNTSMFCSLAISATVVMAGGMEPPLATSGESSAALRALPTVHVALGGPQEEANEQVSIEGFCPFSRQEQQLLFLQGGWQRQQQRNLLSFGVGWRYFPEMHWGVGGNLFYDQDTTRRQRRVGVGVEAWWQSLTLAVNHYLPANGWRAARDLKAYQQRSANGYDVTLRGYLPVLPHIGASVRYAHYFGDEVALGGVQQRYRNPKQWRWGIDYTPIPLLTLAYHRQAGLSGHSKHQISAVLSYRFSLPLSQQVDPNQVTLLHSAKGQQLARVQREQIMALKYAKVAVSTAQPQQEPQQEPQPQQEIQQEPQQEPQPITNKEGSGESDEEWQHANKHNSSKHNSSKKNKKSRNNRSK